MLGGGIFVTQDKTLPGSYINFVNASSAGSTIGERGVVAIALYLSETNTGTVTEITNAEFSSKCKTLLGVEPTSEEALPLREIFRHANKAVIYNLGNPVKIDDPDLETKHEAAIKAFEAYEFNVLCVYTDHVGVNDLYCEAVTTWRDELGKKCQAVVHRGEAGRGYEGIIQVEAEVSGDPKLCALTPWVAGAEAACKINESCTNMLYDGEYTIKTNKTQAELEDCIEDGTITFHLVYGEVRMLEDINSLTTTTNDKGEDFKSNQTIRVIDQIANDIARLFNTKYLGRIPNNESGRVALWADIVKHHKELEAIQAIENFDSSLLTIAQGNTKKSVVVNDCVTVTNAMAQLYMTVVIQ